MESSRARDPRTLPVPFRIDAEFKLAMPALDPMERDLLEEALLADGCREPLTVWNSPSGPVLLDGHNRFEICSEHRISFEVVEVDLSGRKSCFDWIDANQLGRRNLNRSQAQLLRGRRFARRRGTWGGKRAKTHNESLKVAAILGKEHGVSRATIERDGLYAKCVSFLSEEIDPTLESRILSGETQVPRTALVEAARLAKTDKEAAWLRLRGTMTSNSEEWATPHQIWALVQDLFQGEIDLDPCSPLDGPTVPARTHYTLREDGLSQEWHGKVFINPPYGPATSDWIDRLLAEREAGNVTEALVLVAARTETAWMARMREYPRVYLRGRLKFSGSKQSAPFPSVIIYLGQDTRRFHQVFSPVGDVFVLYDPSGETCPE